MFFNKMAIFYYSQAEKREELNLGANFSGRVSKIESIHRNSSLDFIYYVPLYMRTGGGFLVKHTNQFTLVLSILLSAHCQLHTYIPAYIWMYI